MRERERWVEDGPAENKGWEGKQYGGRGGIWAATIVVIKLLANGHAHPLLDADALAQLLQALVLLTDDLVL